MRAIFNYTSYVIYINYQVSIMIISEITKLIYYNSENTSTKQKTGEKKKRKRKAKQNSR